MGWGWLGEALELLGACTRHQYGPFVFWESAIKRSCQHLVIQTWLKHPQRVGLHNHNLGFRCFLGGKIGMQDSGLRGFGWVLGCGRTIRTSSWKKMFVLGLYSGVHFWELKVLFQNYFDMRTYAFFWWFSGLRVSLSDFNLFWKFSFLRVSASDFKLCESFVCWELIYSISEVAFWDFFASLRWPFSELPCLRVSTEVSISDVKLSRSFHVWKLIVSFQISNFQRLSISESFHFWGGLSEGWSCHFKFPTFLECMPESRHFNFWESTFSLLIGMVCAEI